MTAAQMAPLQQLLQYRDKDPRIKIVTLSRNFGKEAALSAGLDLAQGRAIIPIDADLQDPPELIIDMVNKWREGYDVVFARRSSRMRDTFGKRTTASLFYRFFNLISDIPIPQDTGDYRLIDRKVVTAIQRMPERNRFMKGLFAWVGFKQAEVAFKRKPRQAGKTNWNYWKLWNFALSGIISFSTLPLRIWSYLGACISLCSFIYAAFLIIRTLIFGVDVPGYASLMVVILIMGGLNLVVLGIIGEYLGRTYIESKQRPLYVINECHGIKDKRY